MKRREFLGSATFASVGVLAAARYAGAATVAARAHDWADEAGGGAAPLPPVTVYKSPSCGCCGEWVKHMEKAGFRVKVIPMEDLTKVKRDAGVPGALESCHTALIGTYVLEGHVPADLVKKMLDEKPKITGLAVGGMVVGSPGMEQGSTKQPYDVMAFTRGGIPTVYARR